MTLTGSTVTAWRDKSGNGNTATANGAPQVSPAGIVTTITTSPGDNFYIEPLNNPPSTNTLSISVVATLNSYSGGLQWQYGRIVSFWNGTGSDFNTNTFIICQQGNTQAIGVYHNGGLLFSAYPITYGVPFITTLIWDGTNCAWYVNGSLAGYTSSSNTFSFSKLGICVNISTKAWPYDCVNGVISEVIMYYYAMPALQAIQLQTNLIQKWGLTVPGQNVWQRPLYVGNTLSAIANGSLVTAGTIINIPQYVKANLVYFLDAGNPSSYPGSGNTWYDLTGSEIATTINGSTTPTYHTENGGYILFDPSAQQYGQTSNFITDLFHWSVEVWHYYTNTNTTGSPCIMTQIFSGSIINFNLGVNNDNQYGLTAGYFNGGFHSTRSDYSLPAVGWYHIVGTFDGENVKLYVNNVLIDTVASTNSSYSPTNGYYFMRRWDNQDFWGGALAIVRIYKEALSVKQVNQNYGVGKSRFGLS
jgi:hypothetical protein